jgi:pSer/pThr/pTyr-binding forkhead associated (FHA) protein
MLKLTTSLNKQHINAIVFDKNIVHIGSDPSNDLSIDHPSIAPIHASITQKGYAYIISQIDNSHPLIINDKKIKEARLINNDRIMINNYSIAFNSAKLMDLPKTNKHTPTPSKKINLPSANFQILSGQHIGRVITMAKNKLSFGQRGTSVAVISRETEGYSIAAKDGHATILVNHEPLDTQPIILNDNDMLIVDNISMQFFLKG